MENENKQIKASKWAFGILCILSAIVLIMFYCIGYDNTEFLNNDNLTAPTYTGLLIIWMYAMVVLCAGAMLGFGIAAGIKGMKSRGKGSKGGFVGIVFLLTAAIVVLSYFMGSTEPVVTGEEIVSDFGTLKLTDTCLYSMYVLIVVATICTALSMVGVFKSKK
ncbi:MAG: hypothetical protein MJY58_01095 [Bacteroidaceae bacterium]|nr:hypothetical protein [Bacteroidaceae bacterium]